MIPERRPEEPKPEATRTVTEAASSVSSIVTPAAVATDAPTTTEVAAEAPVITKSRRAEPARPAATLSDSYNEVPELKPRRPRWLIPLGVAAAIGLGVVGLRSLDRPPTATPEALTRPITKAKPLAKTSAKSGEVRPKSDDDDDDDGNDPNTGNDPPPDPTPAEPDPLKAKAPTTTALAVPAAASGAAPAIVAAPPASAVAPGAVAPGPTAGSLQINVTSDPPGARMFWKGKEVGTTPFVLEFPAGERHAYEVGLPGYTTRKVVVDGSKTEITIGLRPDAGSGFGSSH